MDRIERIEHPQESQLIVNEGLKAEIWKTMPGIIQSFDPIEMTVTVQPSLQMWLENEIAGTAGWVSLPLLVDVPIVISSSGGMSVTMPINAGDECLVSFADRCIDAWWQLGAVQPQLEFRMHDLSDGFAFIGPRSLPRVLANYSTTSMQLRSDDGLVTFDINPTTHKITLTAPGNLAIIAPTTTITGDVTITGTLTATTDVIGGGKSLKTHVHSGVQSGSSNTGQPV